MIGDGPMTKEIMEKIRECNLKSGALRKKPTTKQEMVEWLAETVLGWKQVKNYLPYIWWESNPGAATMSSGSAREFIYSPDGEEAVWDALEKKIRLLRVTFNQLPEREGYNCWVQNYGDGKEFMGTGKTRREAFYNAVYEAWG